MSLINPADSIERQNEKLVVIAQSLMRRVEQKTDQSGLAYAQFERAAILEAQVKQRTLDLERTLDLLQDSNARLAEANLATEAARANLAEAIEAVTEGFALFDADDMLVLTNSRFCRDFMDIGDSLIEGLSFEAYVGLISQSRFLSLPDGETQANWAERRMARHRDDHVVFNVRLTLDRWLQVSEHRTSFGGTVILQTDVTDIIRAERQERDKLRDRQAAMFRATLDHLNQGVCIFDANKTLVGWNKKMDSLLDLPLRSSAVGLDFFTLLGNLEGQIDYGDGFSAERLRQWARRVGGRQPIAFEVKRGADRVLSVFAQEMPDRGFVISFTDVTAERAAARALFEMNEMLERRVDARTVELGEALAEAERANASKSRFVAAASHDLLQPLSAAKLFVSSLSERLDDPAMRDVAGKAENALSSVEQIIEALLDISKLDSGRASFEVQPVRLSAILRPLLDELGPVARAKGLKLRIVDSALSVRSDPGFLRRIVQNLISNAIRYTDAGRVLVGVRRNGGSARIEIWDTGRGIAVQDQKAIFHEFKRLDPTGSAEGLGLGLAIVERACKSLGHPLGLWSKPGFGSCFSLNVPVYDSHPVYDPQPDTEPQALAAPGGLIVLLVENDVPLANAISMMIEGWNAQVIHAESGEDALELLSEIQLIPDAMLLDHQLGTGMTGAEFYRAIRTRYGEVPTCLVSADRTRDLRQIANDLGVELVAKPIDRDKLFRFLGDAQQNGSARPP